MSAHLGPLVSALVDDQLPPAARDRALAHLAICERCTEEVRDTRVAHKLMSNAAGTPALRSDFIDGLLTMASAEVHYERARPDSAENPFVTHSAVPGGAYCGVLSKPHGFKQWLKYGSVFALGGACAVAFLLGARPVISPKTDTDTVAARLALLRNSAAFNPLYEVTATQADGTKSGIDTAKLSTWLEQHGWTAPSALPAGVTITEVGFLSDQPDELEIVVETPVGEILIVESRGVLDESITKTATKLTLERGSAYVLSDNPAHLTWQSGDTVIELHSTHSVDEIMQFAGTFEAQHHDSGISARMARGFTNLAGVVSD